MRIAGAILLSAVCSFVGIQCYAQNHPCPAHDSSKAGKKTLTAAEQVHRLLLQTPRDDWSRLWVGDVLAILRCGSRQDADEFFAALDNALARMDGTVLEADQNSIRVVVHDGLPPLGVFWFTFDAPLAVIPHPGEEVVISGTYSSYNREPLQIKMTKSAFSVVPQMPF